MSLTLIKSLGYKWTEQRIRVLDKIHMKYIIYWNKDALSIKTGSSTGLLLSRLEMGINIEPNPKEDEYFKEIDDLSGVIMPYDTNKQNDFKSLMAKVRVVDEY